MTASNTDNVRYRTVGGNIVTWTPGDDGNTEFGTWSCGGCKDKERGSKDGADRHAQSCRAL